MIQGLLAGLGFFIFGVPNALLLTLLAAAAGIFPIVGPTIVWIPVAIFLLLAGNTVPAVGVIAFGLASAFIDNFIRPIIVAKRTSISSPVILIGMIGGLFLFGILGFILGPLILAYLFIILELYRNKSLPGVFIHNPTKG
jgi:predicted PurR-regulated permease PerM